MDTERDVVVRRIVATLIDLPIVFAVFYVGEVVYLGEIGIPEVVSVLGSLAWFVFNAFGLMPFFLFRRGDPALVFLLAAGTWAAYAAILEWLFGQTVGKKLTGLVVASRDGTHASPSAIVTRNALRAVDALMFYVIGFLVVVMTDRRQRIGDLAAGTVVVATSPDEANR